MGPTAQSLAHRNTPQTSAITAKLVLLGSRHSRAGSSKSVRFCSKEDLGSSVSCASC